MEHETQTLCEFLLSLFARYPPIARIIGAAMHRIFEMCTSYALDWTIIPQDPN